MGDPSKWARMASAGYRLKAAEIAELAEGYAALEREAAKWHDLYHDNHTQFRQDCERCQAVDAALKGG